MKQLGLFPTAAEPAPAPAPPRQRPRGPAAIAARAYLATRCLREYRPGRDEPPRRCTLNAGHGGACGPWVVQVGPAVELLAALIVELDG